MLEAPNASELPLPVPESTKQLRPTAQASTARRLGLLKGSKGGLGVGGLGYGVYKGVSDGDLKAAWGGVGFGI